MRQKTAVYLFVFVMLALLAVYAIAALYFDGIINFIELIWEGLKTVKDIIYMVLDSIYQTFLA